MQRTGVAVLGTGFMGRTHVEALRRIESVEVIGCLGSTPEKSIDFARRLGIAKGFASLDAVLDDPSIRAVHIGTPNRLHFEMARRCLEAGRHVLCEKPLAMNSRESAQLVDLAARRPHLVAAVNYNIRFYPLCVEARDRVRGGAVGEVVHVTGGYVQDWLLRATDYNWRVLAEEGGALRAIADIGTHWLDLVHSITGLEVESLCADLLVAHPTRRRPLGEVETFSGHDAARVDTEEIDVTTEDHGSVLLRFRGGARGCLSVSQVTAGRKNSLHLEIAARERTIAWNSERPNELWLGRREGPNETLPKDPTLLGDAARSVADYPGGHNEGYADSFKQLFRAFHDRVASADGAGGAPDTQDLLPTFADGHREIVLCDAILRSHRERRWISIEGLD